jgi:KaiC/GvpD/RAD55 family RecA-like ATPase
MATASTGIPRLDSALHGGYALPGVTLLEGAPGSGKTPLGIAFASTALKDGRKTIYIATNNLPDELKGIARSIGYDIGGAIFMDCYSWLVGGEGEGIYSLLDLNLLLEAFDDMLSENEAECIVLDTLSSFFVHHDEAGVLKFVQAFAALAKSRNSCALVLVESGTCSDGMRASLRYITDIDILLKDGTIAVRRVATFAHEAAKIPFEVTPQGIRVTALPPARRGEEFPLPPLPKKKLRFW